MMRRGYILLLACSARAAQITVEAGGSIVLNGGDGSGSGSSATDSALLASMQQSIHEMEAKIAALEAAVFSPPSPPKSPPSAPPPAGQCQDGAWRSGHDCHGAISGGELNTASCPAGSCTPEACLQAVIAEHPTAVCASFSNGYCYARSQTSVGSNIAYQSCPIVYD